MTMTFQIILGSLMLGLCSAIHLGILICVIRLLQSFGKIFEVKSNGSRWSLMMVMAFAAIVLAHTIQIWLWAVSFMLLSALPNIADAIYFSLVTYTTLGYGDVTVDIGLRIYAAMAAVTGLLNFGLSTAFLVGLFARLLSSEID